MPTIVQYHRFPAAIKTSDGWSMRRTAVVVKDGIARVADSRGTVVQERDDFVGIEQSPRTDTTLRFANGDAWTVGMGDGCGCSSPLQRWYLAQLMPRPVRVGT